MKQNTARDYNEIVQFAAGYLNKTTLECIEAYAAKRRIAAYRAGKAFWAQADAGAIQIHENGGLFYIEGVIM